MSTTLIDATITLCLWAVGLAGIAWIVISLARCFSRRSYERMMHVKTRPVRDPRREVYRNYAVGSDVK